MAGRGTDIILGGNPKVCTASIIVSICSFNALVLCFRRMIYLVQSVHTEHCLRAGASEKFIIFSKLHFTLLTILDAGERSYGGQLTVIFDEGSRKC